jgi:hypothetical protein
MRVIAAATALYFGLVFGAGFLLGPIRVLLLEPHIGALWAVAIEVPLLLVVMVLAARWSAHKATLGDSLGPRAAMGAAALVLVLAADFSVGRWIRGLALADQLRHFSTLEGMVYAAALVLFAAMPVIVCMIGSRR